MNITCYKNIVFYKGNFYTDKEQIKTSYLHNRLKTDEYKFTPLDIKSMQFSNTPIVYDKNILLIHHFHWNAAHLMWDHIYPSWYGLFHNLTENIENTNFQWIHILNEGDIHIHTHKKQIEIFSENIICSLESFSDKYDNPLIIPLLITGLENIGISNIEKNNLYVKKGLEINNKDPIEVFVNRWYSKYNIKRNTLLNEFDKNICNNIIYIVNKRPYYGMEEFFIKMNDKYSNKYNFQIINYESLNFKEQLEILNKTCICIVGVGSARFNTPFLPNGAIEIQTFNIDQNRKNFIEYLDYHGGTLSKYVKVKNIPYYTHDEAISMKYSNLLETYIDESLNEIPCKIPVNLEENIPLEIRKLT